MTGANGDARRGLLIGRHAEQALIAARLADREAGSAILVRGPAGIGKTTLIDEAVRRAGPSRRILRTVGNSPETGMAASLPAVLNPAKDPGQRGACKPVSPAGAASIARVCAMIGLLTTDPGLANARLASSSRLARCSSPTVSPLRS